MESNNDVSAGERTQPVVLISQLMQEAAHMHHIDEVFSWLVHAMTQRWNIPVVQLWAAQTYRTGPFQVELRAVASQNPSLPQQVYINRQTSAMTEHFFREQQNVLPLPVTKLFPASQAHLFTHYQLHYWAAYFLKNDKLLVPMRGEATVEKEATPLRVLVSFFTQSAPEPHLLRAISFLSEQAIRIAINQGFLASNSPQQPIL